MRLRSFFLPFLLVAALVAGALSLASGVAPAEAATGPAATAQFAPEAPAEVVVPEAAVFPMAMMMSVQGCTSDTRSKSRVRNTGTSEITNYVKFWAKVFYYKCSKSVVVANVSAGYGPDKSKQSKVNCNSRWFKSLWADPTAMANKNVGGKTMGCYASGTSRVWDMGRVSLGLGGGDRCFNAIMKVYRDKGGDMSATPPTVCIPSYTS